LTRDQLSVFTPDEWRQNKDKLIYESWVSQAREAVDAKTAATKIEAPRGTDFKRRTIYHSPQTPGYTCWVGAWQMPDKSLMVAFKQATGPVEGRPRSIDLFKKMGVDTKDPQRDFTGLELANIYLRSTDCGQTWAQTAEET